MEYQHIDDNIRLLFVLPTRLMTMLYRSSQCCRYSILYCWNHDVYVNSRYINTITVLRSEQRPRATPKTVGWRHPPTTVGPWLGRKPRQQTVKEQVRSRTAQSRFAARSPVVFNLPANIVYLLSAASVGGKQSDASCAVMVRKTFTFFPPNTFYTRLISLRGRGRKPATATA